MSRRTLAHVDTNKRKDDMQEESTNSRECLDAENLKLYTEMVTSPLKLELPEQVRTVYAEHFEKNTCPACRGDIESANHGVLNGVEYMICQRDRCWTLCYTSSQHLEASSYSVTFTSDGVLTESQVAKLARELRNYSQATSIEHPLSIGFEMFPNILETNEGWFWVHFVPLLWSFEYDNIEDEEDLKELKALPFPQRVGRLKARHWDQLADYGWVDTQDRIAKEMQEIAIEGAILKATVGEFRDSNLQIKELPLDFYLD